MQWAVPTKLCDTVAGKWDSNVSDTAGSLKFAEQATWTPPELDRSLSSDPCRHQVPALRHERGALVIDIGENPKLLPGDIGPFYGAERSTLYGRSPVSAND